MWCIYSGNLEQGRRKVKNSGGASTKRPSAAWKFGQTITILNLGKSGGATAPPPGSGGPVEDREKNAKSDIIYNLTNYNYWRLVNKTFI